MEFFILSAYFQALRVYFVEICSFHTPPDNKEKRILALYTLSRHIENCITICSLFLFCCDIIMRALLK